MVIQAPPEQKIDAMKAFKLLYQVHPHAQIDPQKYQIITSYPETSLDDVPGGWLWWTSVIASGCLYM